MLGILAFTAGCDKDKALRDAQNLVRPVGTRAIDVGHHPKLLFEVFGDRADPRVLPVAAILDSEIVAIGLNDHGWRRLDSLYFAPGTALTLYHAGRPAGQALVTRGMWTTDGPLQNLPGCTWMRPLAAVRLTTTGVEAGSTVELLATSKPLVTRPSSRDVFPAAEVNRIGRATGAELGRLHSLEQIEIDSLEFNARAVSTGATGGLTVVTSFIDPAAGDMGPGRGTSMDLFAIVDQIDGKWQPTYRHVATGPARAVEFQRLLDHVDLDGDGVDEIILESWRYAAENQLVILRFKAGQWHEALRVPLGWCLDEKRGGGGGKGGGRGGN